MGTNLIAVIGHKGLNERIGTTFDVLEEYPVLTAFQMLGIADRCQPFGENTRAEWDWWYTPRPVYSNIPLLRPVLPDLNVRLRIAHIDLYFANEDTILVQSMHKWSLFFEDDLRKGYIESLKVLCTVFDAYDCIISHDSGTINDAVWDKLSFEQILQAGDLVTVEVPTREYFSDRQSGKAYTEHHGRGDWPDDQPLPAGWEYVYWLNQRCYWRMPLSD